MRLSIARWTFGLCVAGLLALGTTALVMSVPATEAVRLRNAFLMEPGVAASVDWSPASPPQGFRWEKRPADERFTALAKTIVGGETDPFEGGLRIARDLLRNAQDRGPIQADLEATYVGITRDGAGYCADFTGVFLGLAHAAGIPAREWAFSFDGFGGHGHAFVEVYDAARGGWRMIDVYNNFYPARIPGGEPMSAMDFRAALKANQPVELRRISREGRLGFPIEAKAFEYYRQGLDEWYLWWGNDVFTYEAQAGVRAALPFGRVAEQAVAVVSDAHPHFRVLDPAHVPGRVARMVELRRVLLAMLVAFCVLLAGAVASGGVLLRARRRVR